MVLISKYNLVRAVRLPIDSGMVPSMRLSLMLLILDVLT